MSTSTVLSGEQLRCRIPLQLSSAIRAAKRSMGPFGHAAIYAKGHHVVHTRNAIDIIRYFTGDSPEETLLRETFVAAQRDLQDGIARLAAMFDSALSAGYEVIATGAHPVLHQRCVLALLPELEQHFVSVTTPYTEPDSILRGFDLPEAAMLQIRDALEAAGENGHIDVTRSSKSGIQHIHIQGFMADVKPLTLAPHLAMSQAYVLVINDILRDQSTLLAILEGFANSTKSLVIVARGLEGDIRRLLETNRSSGVLNVAVFQPEQTGSGARDMLVDIAVATGATLVCEESGHSLATLTPDMLGRASRYELQGTQLILSHPAGDGEKITLRLKEIRALLEKSRYLQLDHDNALRRYARLTGNWVEIRVGESATDPDLSNKISRACCAITKARTSGVIAGGGVGLNEVAKQINATATDNPAERAARYMLTCALQAPHQALRQNGNPGIHPDVISDPAAHARQLVQIAVSLALQFMTIDAAVIRG